MKSFQQFSQDIAKIEKDYNQNYLQAEYNFAVSSAQQAANWAKIEENGDRYNLQYRTAEDDRVRDEHQALAGTTLPPSDPFWNSYYPPNGWNCRCVAVEVLKDKYPESDSKKAIQKGDEATMQIGKDGKNRMEIFRFNPGKEKVVFPPNNPYSKVLSAGKVIEKATEMLPKDNTFKKLKTTKDLSKYFTDFANTEKDYFAKGFKYIKATTKRRVNGYTYMDGSIYLKKNIINEINNGINNIHKGVPTTFSQEKAISTLHHEIMHNANKVGNMRLNNKQTSFMELANEWVSRNRLPDFMKKLGGELQNKELITNRNNTAYNRMVKNYDALLKRLECDKEKSLQIVEKHLINGKYTNQLEGLLKGLETSDKFRITEKHKEYIMKNAVIRSNDYFNKMLENESLFIKKSL